MKRSIFIVYFLAAVVGFADMSAAKQPAASKPSADSLRVLYEHFPSRMHAFIWRNWRSVSLERMAEVLQTEPENIRKIGRSMGLPSYRPPGNMYQQRGYISLIRRNWHLIPREQLLTLLGWTEEKLKFSLQEDDFLAIKLGPSPAQSGPKLLYHPQTDKEKTRCAEIKGLVLHHFGDELETPGEDRFSFIKHLSSATGKQAYPVPVRRDEGMIRFLYSYFALYGDPLLHPELDPYPEGLLQRLSSVGVNGVWLHVVLRQLAPSKIFPEFGQGHEKRLAALRKLVQRGRKYGIRIYLYMNEPRSMPAGFFKGRKNIKGIPGGAGFAMCTSAPEVRQWMRNALCYVFQQVPGLGGVFTITASENLTNCWCRGGGGGCPRCSKRTPAEVIAQVNRTIAEGVWQGNPAADVIVWDWGWHADWAKAIINALPEKVYLMSVSEWDLPITRGGIKSTIGEYSLSAVGPGPRATRHWAWAKSRHLKTLAKVQLNCTWELSALPFLPVMNLVAQHCSNLTRSGVSGLMLSWTLGGYPSANLELAAQFEEKPLPTIRQALSAVAKSNYGSRAVPDILQAWSRFSRAFQQYPFGGGLYYGPAQVGPANLLFPEPTGLRATMVGFPFDDIDMWRRNYPAEIFASQFAKVASGWKAGLAFFQSALQNAATPQEKYQIHRDMGIAEAAYLHFQSVADQVRFTLARNRLLQEKLDAAARQACLDEMKTMAEQELQIARRLFILCREDSRIGFEASNQYYYYPLDLVEKVINCEYILNKIHVGYDFSHRESSKPLL